MIGKVDRDFDRTWKTCIFNTTQLLVSGGLNDAFLFRGRGGRLVFQRPESYSTHPTGAKRGDFLNPSKVIVDIQQKLRSSKVYLIYKCLSSPNPPKKNTVRRRHIQISTFVPKLLNSIFYSTNGYLVVWGPVVWIPGIPLWKGLLLRGIWGIPTVDGSEIPNNHLGCFWNLVKNGINYQPQLVEDFLHQQ